MKKIKHSLNPRTVFVFRKRDVKVFRPDTTPTVSSTDPTVTTTTVTTH